MNSKNRCDLLISETETTNMLVATDCSLVRWEGTGAPELLPTLMNPLVANWERKTNSSQLLFIELISSLLPPHPIWSPLGQDSRHVLWDSRLLHSSSSSTRMRHHPEREKEGEKRGRGWGQETLTVTGEEGTHAGGCYSCSNQWKYSSSSQFNITHLNREETRGLTSWSVAPTCLWTHIKKNCCNSVSWAKTSEGIFISLRRGEEEEEGMGGGGGRSLQKMNHKVVEVLTLAKS